MDLTLTTVSTGLQKILENFTNNNLIAKVFTNDATVTEATVLADLTESANYTKQTLTGGAWTISYNSGKGQAVYNSTFSFTFTGTDTIRGIYIVDSTETILVSVTKFTTAIPVESGTVFSQPNLQITLDN